MNCPDENEPLPRLLYLADVPVGNTFAGGALLYRLFLDYPKDRLMIICPPQAHSTHLPDVHYHHETDRWWPRLSRTRLSTPYALAISCWRAVNTGRVHRISSDFHPEAVVTVAQSGSWICAWKFAKRYRLPLYMIVHDDDNFLTVFPKKSHAWVRECFASAYREAAARFCISPAMARIYEETYGVPGTLLLPSSNPAQPAFSEPAAHILDNKNSLSFVYAGSIHGDTNIRQLASLAEKLHSLGHRLTVYSPQHAALAHEARNRFSPIDCRQPVDPDSLTSILRDTADVLVVTAGFSEDQKNAVRTLFHTKLADYSTVGLPVFIHAPDYSAVSSFFSEYPEVVEISTDSECTGDMENSIRRLEQPEHRYRLATALLKLGSSRFSSRQAFQSFSKTLLANRRRTSA